jgi:anti-anti-sigma factor
MSERNMIEIGIADGGVFVKLAADLLNRRESAVEAAREVCRWLGEHPDESSQVRIDFAHTGIVNSASLNSLIHLRSTVIQHGGGMVLCNVNPPVRDVFRFTRLERIFEFDETCAVVKLT